MPLIATVKIHTEKCRRYRTDQKIHQSNILCIDSMENGNFNTVFQQNIPIFARDASNFVSDFSDAMSAHND